MRSDPPAGKRKKMALGKGLGALIPELDVDDQQGKTYFQCPVDQIHPNRFQPRQRFAESELEELRQSIKNQGILQPLLVRKDGTHYELIAGERRLRAAKAAGLKKVPVVVKDIGETDLLEMSIIENIQRENLTPLEEAEAYGQLMLKLGLTQDEVAGRVGKSRSAVANFLRLRQLPSQIKNSISEGKLSMGHARALLGARNQAVQNRIWREILARGLSVRDTEKRIRQESRASRDASSKTKRSENTYFISLSEELSRRFGTKVQIIRKGRRGKIAVEFYSDEDLDRIINLLQGS